MCEGQETPLCVEWCLNDVLVLEEREEVVENQPSLDQMEAGIDALIERFGLDSVENAVARMAGKDSHFK